MRRLSLIHMAAPLIALLIASLACDLPVEFAPQGDTVGATETMQALATVVAGTLVAQAISSKIKPFVFSDIPPGTYWIGVDYPSEWCEIGARMNTRPTHYTFEVGPDRQFLFGFVCFIGF